MVRDLFQCLQNASDQTNLLLLRLGHVLQSLGALSCGKQPKETLGRDVVVYTLSPRD